MNETEYKYEGKNLDNWLENGIKTTLSGFPRSENYFDRYNNIKKWLVKNVYKEIQAAVLFSDIQAKRTPVYLNNHGEEHVNSVIARASDIIRNSCQIDPYQIYILLVAILIHDAGNIYGRENHETMCLKILIAMGDIAGEESSEIKIIRQIAQVHTGKINGDQDTIATLAPYTEYLGYKVYQPFLAGLLRFADELADDCSRASRFMRKEKKLGFNQIYHDYSNALKSVSVDGRSIKLRYELIKSEIENTIPISQKKEKFLIDYIYERINKMYVEGVYCSRHIRPHTVKPIADKVSVEIEFLENYQTLKPIYVPLQFIVEEKGYPESHENGLLELCPKLAEYTGILLKGKIESGIGEK